MRRGSKRPPPARRFRGGGFFGVGTAFLILIFLFSSIYLVQFLCLLLLFVFLGSKAYSEYLIRGIVISRRDTELRVFRNEWVRVELAVENHGRLPAPMLAVSDSPGGLPVFRENRVLRSLRSRSRMTLRWQAYCAARGIFAIGPASFRGSDPLGLFPFSVSVPVTVTLFVYPAAGIIGLKPPGGVPLGTLITGNPLYEDLTRCRSLRDYHAGDELRRINWKASARGGALMVNDYESTLSYPLVIFLNADPAAYPLHKRELQMERAIEAAVALCLMASRERQELGMVIYAPGTRSPLTLISPAAFTLIPILERLAGLERAKGEAPETGPIGNGMTFGEGSPGEAPPRGAPGSGVAPGDGAPGGALDTGAALGDGAPGEIPLQGAAMALLDRGKYLPYGTRLVYAGPELTEGEYRALNSLKRYHLTLEYLVIDERSLPALTPGNSRRYLMKEAGYEIL